MDKEKFLKELEKEHEAILNILKSLEPVLKNNNIDTLSAIKSLNQIRDILIHHLKSEDCIFYPDMREKAVELNQDALLPALDFFIDDMKNISKKVFDFFSRYKSEEDIVNSRENFIRCIKELRDAIVKRINTEEETLYYIYRAYYKI